LSIARWRFLHGPHGQFWLSVSTGTALAYVFAYLLPKLASIQSTLSEVARPTQAFLRNHAYLLALAGLLTYFAIISAIESPSSPESKKPAPPHIVVLLLVGYGFYSLQLGYLAADLPNPDFASYALVAVVLGLHLMGINHQLHRTYPHEYQTYLRYGYVVALVIGWAGGIATTAFESTVMYSSTFVAGGIIITAIKEEIAEHGEKRRATFIIAALMAVAVILTIQAWQDV